MENNLPTVMTCPICGTALHKKETKPNGEWLDVMQDDGSCTELYDGHVQEYTCDNRHTIYITIEK